MRDLVIGLGLSLSITTFASAGGTWAMTFGGSKEDALYDVLENEAGYLLFGRTYSFGAPRGDAWVVQLDTDGHVVWEKRYSGPKNDILVSGAHTDDGGSVLVGSTESFGAASSDAWVLKLRSNGAVDWQKRYGGSQGDYGYSIQSTADGGYIFCGITRSFGLGDYDAWVVKLDGAGNVVWQKVYGRSSLPDYGNSIIQVEDGGYLLVGRSTTVLNLPILITHYDAWVLKLSAAGDVISSATYGGFDYDALFSAGRNQAGGIVAVGNTSSGSSSDAWLVKLDDNGRATWQKRFGVKNVGDTANSVRQTEDGGYVVGGTSQGGAWVFKLTAAGKYKWKMTYGGTLQEVRPTQDGSYIVVGSTTASGAGEADAFIIKVDDKGNHPGCSIAQKSKAKRFKSSAAFSSASAAASNSSAVGSATGAKAKNTSGVVGTLCP